MENNKDIYESPQCSQRFYFRPSWFETCDLFESDQERTAYMGVIRNLSEGKQIDMASLPYAVRTHVPNLTRCFNFDEREKERRSAGKSVARVTRDKVCKADKVSKAYKVSKANQVCEADQVKEEKDQTKSSSSSSNLREEERKGFSFSENDINTACGYWNEAIDRNGARLIRLETDSASLEMKTTVGKRLHQFGIEGFRKAVENAARSRFMNITAKTAPFDFARFLNYQTFCKIHDNVFDNGEEQKGRPASSKPNLPTAEEIANSKGFARNTNKIR